MKVVWISLKNRLKLLSLFWKIVKQLKFKTSEQIKTQETIAALKVDINRLKKRDDSSLALQEDVLRRKINLENSIDNITNAYAALAEIKLELNALHAKYVKLISKRKALPQSVLSTKDVEKLNSLKSGM